MTGRDPQLVYQAGGLGNELASEAVPGALPIGQNSPQAPPLGLYTEQISGTAFTALRAQNRRTWLYKMRPSAKHRRFARIGNGLLRSAPFNEVDTPPDRFRWDPLPMPAAGTDFIDGLVTLAGNGDAAMRKGAALHIYCANRSMQDRYFFDADGELMIVPQLGELLLCTELGKLAVAPGEFAVIPRGVKFRAEIIAPRDGPAAQARGFVCENYGAHFRLPELGVIGANGLAGAYDFAAPVAAYEDGEQQVEVIAKMLGNLWSSRWEHSPLDTVAWRGNYAPYKYDLKSFMAINTVSFDHCDPSVHTVLTSPSGEPGAANVDFVVFPPRWLVADHTFRPPWFHRNAMSEFVGLLRGASEVRAAGSPPGSAYLHNCMSAHGPDYGVFQKASREELKPHYLEGSLAVMWESLYVLRPTRYAMETPTLQQDYDSIWDGFGRQFGRPLRPEPSPSSEEPTTFPGFGTLAGEA